MSLLKLIRNTIKSQGYLRKEWKLIEKEAEKLVEDNEQLRKKLKKLEEETS